MKSAPMWPHFQLNISTLTEAVSVLTAMITPALLLSACGTLILSTSNRLARIVDRIRSSPSMSRNSPTPSAMSSCGKNECTMAARR